MTSFEAAAGRSDERESSERQRTLGHAAGGLASKRIITAYGLSLIHI